MFAARFSLVVLVVLAAAVSLSHASYGEECPWGCNDYNTLLGNPVCRCKQTETCLADATWNGHEVGKCIPNGASLMSCSLTISCLFGKSVVARTVTVT